MIIETWILAMFAVVGIIFGLIAMAGWMIADQRNENLVEENKELVKENTLLKSKMSFIRLCKESKGDKNE